MIKAGNHNGSAQELTDAGPKPGILPPSTQLWSGAVEAEGTPWSQLACLEDTGCLVAAPGQLEPGLLVGLGEGRRAHLRASLALGTGGWWS